MKKQLIAAGTLVLGGAYALAKLRPIDDKATFISRQQNAPTLDIDMLSDYLADNGVDSVLLCKKLGNGIPAKLGYSLHMIKQLYHMSNSKLIVLDSYCILASLLKHREGTKVVQMWHALGSMKKFGRSILDQPEGHSSELADLMKMHENYDVIFTSSEASRGAFAEAFGYDPDNLTVMSLPRVDALLDKERDAELKEEITEKYPELAQKENILYAPTFREDFDMTGAYKDVIEAVDTKKYNLILKTHPAHDMNLDWDALSDAASDKSGDGAVIIDKTFATMDIFSVTDYFITDYSALTYEAAVKGLPMYFYAYDLDEYLENRSFYLDYKEEIPGMISEDVGEIMKAISSGKYDAAKIKAFSDKYVENQMNCTKAMGDYLLNLVD